jgi:hypothetical protein
MSIELVVILLGVIITGATGILAKVIKAANPVLEGIKDPATQDALRFALDTLEDVAVIAVNAAEQTAVKKAKADADGVLLPSEALAIKEAVVHSVITSVGSHVSDLLIEQLGEPEFIELVGNVVESTIKDSK